MANNFHISRRRNGNSLYFDLTGNFDGTSAMELSYAIAEHGNSTQRVFINTDDLVDLSPFGKQVFVNRSSLPPSLLQKLIFTGKHGSELIPKQLPLG